MSILSRHYNKKLCTVSPCIVDFERKVSIVDGNEVITFEKIDNRKRVIANGTVAYWSLSNLIKAGINPNTGIHTSNVTRLEGLRDINEFGTAADLIINADKYIEHTVEPTEETIEE